MDAVECVHHWIIETPSEGHTFVPGTCKKCGTTQPFRAGTEDKDKHGNPTTGGNHPLNQGTPFDKRRRSRSQVSQAASRAMERAKRMTKAER